VSRRHQEVPARRRIEFFTSARGQLDADQIPVLPGLEKGFRALPRYCEGLQLLLDRFAEDSVAASEAANNLVQVFFIRLTPTLSTNS